MGKAKIRLKGQIRSYVQWPLRFSVLIIIFNIIMYFVNIKAGLYTSVFAFLYILIAMTLYVRSKTIVINDFISFATQYGQVQKQLLRELEIPYALLDENGRLIWANKAFEDTFHVKKNSQRSITSVIPDLTKDKLPLKDHAEEPDPEAGQKEEMLRFEGQDFRYSMKKVSVKTMIRDSPVTEELDNDSYLIAFFLFDETDVTRLREKLEQTKPAVGLIYIDNYDEALQTVEDVRRSLLAALVDRQINKSMAAHDAIVKKLEKDKYLVILQQKDLRQLEEKRFSILEEAKNVNIGNEMALTLSIGFGVGAESYTENYDHARNAMDLALGRGGDQAIVKNGDQITYFGGKSMMTEKYTRVKARVKAHALREIIEGSDQILVMGHQITDIDALGAAIGVVRAAKTFNKNANIVINDISSSIRPMVDSLIEAEDEKDLIINNMQALERADKNTAVILVDVNKPSYTECPELMNRCQTIVVLDHHRQGEEKIENATLSYIEPYASSASEMAAEILQYINDRVKLKPVEADCLYAGIMVDTNNFMIRTGVRTFEAAAYLRRNGADVTRVRKLFRDSMEAYKARNEAISHVEMFEDKYAISYFDGKSESPTVVAAQAANELLNISNVRASFVLSNYQNKTYISARSYEEVNVQLIMERLGGGGHMTVAGAQIEGVSIEEGKRQLMETLRAMEKEGEL
ncbi:MAG: DHH family phosphoesterase [Lachnospiraceae bacterium]|nr:DHH family phosphoesterase [Lachnospiraceae bacterium]